MAHSLTSIVAIAFLQYYLASHNILKLHQRKTRCLPSLPLITLLALEIIGRYWKLHVHFEVSLSLSQSISGPSTTKKRKPMTNRLLGQVGAGHEAGSTEPKSTEEKSCDPAQDASGGDGVPEMTGFGIGLVAGPETKKET